MIGIRRPTAGFREWFCLHQDQARACMTDVEYELMCDQIGVEP
jgi:hypothetical protein